MPDEKPVDPLYHVVRVNVDKPADATRFVGLCAEAIRDGWTPHGFSVAVSAGYEVMYQAFVRYPWLEPDAPILGGPPILARAAEDSPDESWSDEARAAYDRIHAANPSFPDPETAK
jgi:hypothetical protein